MQDEKNREKSGVVGADHPSLFNGSAQLGQLVARIARRHGRWRSRGPLRAQPGGSLGVRRRHVPNGVLRELVA